MGVTVIKKSVVKHGALTEQNSVVGRIIKVASGSAPWRALLHYGQIKWVVIYMQGGAVASTVSS